MSSLVFWLTVGFMGQVVFTARFVLQWVVSERRGNSVVPVAFWWLSLVGGTALMCYAISRRDAVIVTGQGMGLFVYARNLILVRKAKRLQTQANQARSGASPSSCSRAIPTSGARMSDSPTRMAEIPAA